MDEKPLANNIFSLTESHAVIHSSLQEKFNVFNEGYCILEEEPVTTVRVEDDLAIWDLLVNQVAV